VPDSPRQRRHQKLTEETPSPFMTDDLRKRMEDDAARRAIDAYNAGLVELAVKNATVDIPEIMIEDRAEQMVQELAMNLEGRGLKLEDYLKFSNKTNGITFRRWLMGCNPELAQYLDALIGDSWRTTGNLEGLLEYQNNDEVLNRLQEIKHIAKDRMSKFLLDTQDAKVNADSIIDVQVKRFHEYKRQQMNALYVIHKYLEIKAGKLPKRKITVIFGGKAAPAYIIAQDIIHLILCLSELINNDPEVNKYLNVHLVENYNVSVAEKLIPATDISEQISLASKEASGTGNMKFMLNGALTLGTMDGANVEIAELAGAENIYTFGKDSESIIKLYETAGYVSKEYYENDKDIKRAVDFILNPAVVKLGNKTRLERLYNELLNKDWFMTLIDFNAYVEAKEQILADYEDQDSWHEKVVHNIAKAGFFSSDRTIAQYNADIWHCEG